MSTRVDELRELLAKATPGPWSCHWPQVLSGPYWGVEPLLTVNTHEGYEVQADANAALIVALVNNAEALLEVAEAAAWQVRSSGWVQGRLHAALAKLEASE